MSKSLNSFLKQSLKGIWSPFFRRKINKELRNHYEDLKEDGGYSDAEALLNLGEPAGLNSLYKKLFYKKLRSDFYIVSVLSLFLFGGTVVYITNQR